MSGRAAVRAFPLVVSLLAVLAAGCPRRATPGPDPVPSASASASASAEASASASISSAAPAPSASADDDIIFEDPDGGAVVDQGEDAGADPTEDPRFADLPARTVAEGSQHKIAAKALQAWVHKYPDDESTFLGYLRAGTVVDRSAEPIIKTKRCKGGWYEVLPRGYLCAGKRATLDLEDPIVKASWKPPKRGEPLPYAYVRPADPPPYLYFTLPSKKDQLRFEGPQLEEHLVTHAPSRLPNVSELGTPEPIPDFLQPPKELPNPYGASQRLRFRVQEGKADPQAAFALLSVHEHEGRWFGLTTELDLLAIDRTKIVRPPATRGGKVEGLPAAIVLTHDTPRFTIEEGAETPKKDGTWTRRDVLGLTGKRKGALLETIDGHWVSGGMVRVLQPRTRFPSFVTEGKKWIDISLKEQMLIAYEGTKAVYVAYISTGLSEMGDPKKTFATVRGVFTIKSKHLTATMRGSAQADYEIADVPYVQYFHESYALHAAFWHDDFGRVHSHGCVNLPPVDAAWLFEWTDPVVPPTWHGANAISGEPGTVVYVHG